MVKVLENRGILTKSEGGEEVSKSTDPCDRGGSPPFPAQLKSFIPFA